LVEDYFKPLRVSDCTTHGELIFQQSFGPK
jgi:hypothetical protein